jgi:predicted Fe-Mo cluster-binding NifX family protein
MKICISSSGPGLDDEVDPRFGRCQYFGFVDTESMNFEAIPNSFMMSGGGAGIQAAQFVLNQGAKAVITGSVGPKAYDVLAAGGIEIFTGASGTVREVIDSYEKGELGAPQAVPSTGSGMGPGFGMHGGMGMGRGMGGGVGMGRCMGMRPAGAAPGAAASREDEFETLKGQSKMMREQLDQVMKRIEELEQKRKSET